MKAKKPELCLCSVPKPRSHIMIGEDSATIFGQAALGAEMDARRQLWLKNRLKNTNNCFSFQVGADKGFFHMQQCFGSVVLRSERLGHVKLSRYHQQLQCFVVFFACLELRDF